LNFLNCTNRGKHSTAHTETTTVQKRKMLARVGVVGFWFLFKRVLAKNFFCVVVSRRGEENIETKHLDGQRVFNRTHPGLMTTKCWEGGVEHTEFFFLFFPSRGKSCDRDRQV
jgi:hypothetical protein